MDGCGRGAGCVADNENTVCIRRELWTLFDLIEFRDVGRVERGRVRRTERVVLIENEGTYLYWDLVLLGESGTQRDGKGQEISNCEVGEERRRVAEEVGCDEAGCGKVGCDGHMDEEEDGRRRDEQWMVDELKMESDDASSMSTPTSRNKLCEALSTLTSAESLSWSPTSTIICDNYVDHNLRLPFVPFGDSKLVFEASRKRSDSSTLFFLLIEHTYWIRRVSHGQTHLHNRHTHQAAQRGSGPCRNS